MKNNYIARLCALLAISVFSVAAPGQEGGDPPGFSKRFTPDTIGPGSTTRLRFDINNQESSDPITGLAFTDVLPAGVDIATPASAFTDCTNATLSAPNGGTTISLSNGRVGVDGSCFIEVNVTGATIGEHENVSGDLTSSAGNSGPATATLSVDGTLPGFSKQFIPASIPLGSTSTLTFEIDNQDDAPRFSPRFRDVLPPGLVIASPTNASTDCGSASVSATSGDNVVTLSSFGSSVAANSSCTVSVDVTPQRTGRFDNVSEALTSSNSIGQSMDSGFATASLNAPVEYLVKAFIDDPVAPGGTVTLQFTVTNLNRRSAATDITFDDTIDPMGSLVGLAPASTETLPKAACGGTLAFSGGTLSLSGAQLEASQSCTFDVALDVPVGTAVDTYVNTTTALTATIDGGGVVGNTATDRLIILEAPILTKEFTDDPVGAGDTVELEFNITNTSTSAGLESIAFTDELTTFLPFPISATLPPNDFCGVGSTMSLISTATEGQALSVQGGSLDIAGSVGDSCTFSVFINIPAGMPTGSFTNNSSDISALIGGVDPVSGIGASDDLVIVGAPTLSKQFTDDPVQPGGTVTLEFTLGHSEFAAEDATAITFEDNLATVLPGLTATGLPLDNLCGSGSLTGSVGDTLLSFSGGTLAPGESCTFDVTLNVPDPATAGSHANTTSSVIATLGGVDVIGNPASDSLRIAGLELAKEFVDDPVLPGDTTTLRFTIDNVSPTDDATAITLQDNLDTVLNGLVATVLPPADPCGTGSTLAGLNGNRLLYLTGGNLLAGESCSFDVTLQVPANAASQSYINRTNGFAANIGGSVSPIAFENASDNLIVNNQLLFLGKEFTDDPVGPGGSVTLEFSLTNLDASQAMTGVTFTDDLDATLAGLAALGLPATDICGIGSTLSGTDLITLTGGSLPAGGSCTFSVQLQVPLGTNAGLYDNQSSDPEGLLGASTVTGAPAVDQLLVNSLTLSKAFDGPSTAGASPELTFTILNGSITEPVAGISFTDDLDAMLSGVEATGLPMADVCGAGSNLSGTDFLSLTGGNLLPGGSCTFTVPLQVPLTAAPGTYTNTSSVISQGGLALGTAATADLTIEPPPAFAKAFAPVQILYAATSTLTLTIDNSASVLAASALDITDNLPAGVLIATPPNASTTCTGGTLTAVAGTAVLSYTGGTVTAGASCTVQADTTGTAAGVAVNTTGDLTSSSGNSGSATASLTVGDPPQTSYTGALPSGATGTLSFTSSDLGCGFASDPQFLDESGVTPPPPPNVQLADGVISFTIEGCAVGATVNLTMDYGRTLNPQADYWKAGLPWFTLPASISGSSISFSITDGGTGDDDLTADGSITDPGGAALSDAGTDGGPGSAAPIPVMDSLGLWLLAGLMMLTGLGAYRRFNY